MAKSLDNEKRVIVEYLDALGPWRDYVVLGGGYAPFVYKIYFDQNGPGAQPIGTRDLDTLIPRKVPAASEKDLKSHLESAGFKHHFKDMGEPATEAYTREIGGSEVEVEFLTDNSAKDKEKNVNVAGVVAQPLSYLKLSIETTRDFRTDRGHRGRVVSPEAWVFHKGLTFVRRDVGSKRFKDLYGIWYVTSQLNQVSSSAKKALVDLRSGRKAWDHTFVENLKGFLANATEDDGKLSRRKNPMVCSNEQHLQS